MLIISCKEVGVTLNSKSSNLTSEGKRFKVDSSEKFIFTGKIRSTNLDNQSQQSFGIQLIQQPKTSANVTPEDKMFRDLFIEIMHTSDSESVELRLYTQIQQSNPFWTWKDFKFVSVSVQLEDPVDSSKTSLFVVNGDPNNCKHPLCPYNKQTSVKSIISIDFTTIPKSEIVFNDASTQVLGIFKKNLLENGIGTDFELSCGERKFKCHRAILAAHSEVFAAMFTTQMAETINGVMQIKGITVNSLEALLSYFYTGCLNAPIARADVAFELLKTAHKYEIQNLQDAVFNILKVGSLEAVEISTALSMYKKLNAKFLMNHEEFNNFILEQPLLMKQLFLNVCLS